MAAGLGLLTVGMLHLVRLRFAAGDTYPPCSSLRSDPLGGAVLYDALSLMPGLKVRRLYTPIEEIEHPAGTVLLRIGARRPEDPDQRAFLLAGGRVVTALAGRDNDEAAWQSRSETRDRSTNGWSRWRQWRGGQTNDAPEARSGWWSLGVSSGTNAIPDLAVPAVAGFRPVAWRSSLHFAAPASNGWHTLFTVAGEPVIVERACGAGSEVAAADTYFLSNEAQLFDRRPELLAYLVGTATTVLFDEVMHGVQENRNIMWLLRRYRMHGIGACLALLAALYLWQAAVPLLPRAAAEADDLAGDEAGYDVRHGFASLLRRSVPPAELTVTCAAAWERTARVAPQRRQAVRAVVAGETAKPPAARDPVAAWHRIAAILSERDSIHG